MATNPERQRPVPLTFNGRVITDRLTEQDAFFPDGSFYRTYQFIGKAGQRVTLEMQSTEVDPYLILFGPNNAEIAQDSRISTVLPTDGLYTLHANGYERGQTGKYQLLARIDNGQINNQTNNQVNNNQLGDEVDQAVPQTSLATSQPIATGNFNGVFNSDSLTSSQDATLFQRFNFEGQKGQIWRITISSNEFQPELLLFNPKRQLIRQMTAKIGTNNPSQATITIQLPNDGKYQLIAKTTNPAAQGKYNLRVVRVR